MKTTQVTVRGVDEQLKKLIDQHAKKANKSINQFVLDVTSEAVGYKTSSKKPNWRECSGLIDDPDFNDKLFEDFEKIDPEMWK
ncbi:MAG: hypothetical protein QG593_403 [Patescibacteria group bacterium]|nr:hypothetical protein [Patescibacteria group bacterium]